MRRLICDCGVALVVVLLTAPSASVAQFRPLTKSTRPAHAGRVLSTSSLLDCSAAVDVHLGETVCADQLGSAGQVDQYGCSAWPETGAEVIFRLTVSQPTAFEVRLESDCDLDVVLLSGCDAIADCLIVADTGVTTTDLVSGVFYVVIDGFNGADCSFCAQFAERTPPPPIYADPAACAGADPLSCEPQTVTATTCGEGDSVARGSCSGFDERGEDRWYELGLLPQGDLVASAIMDNADAALWLLLDCGSDFQCVGYADATSAGGIEALSYTNATSQDQQLFLVVDTFERPNACSDFTVTIERCHNGIVATVPSSWSAIKSRFSGKVQADGEGRR